MKVETLTPETFAPYGEIIQQPDRASDAGGPGWQWWGELTCLTGGDRPYAAGFLDLHPAPLQFNWAEHHQHTDELIIPLGGDCLVYVAPPESLNLEHFRVFRVKSGQAVLLKKGVWHGAPLAVDQPLKALVLLLHNTGQQDVVIQRFEDQPVTIQQ